MVIRSLSLFLLIAVSIDAIADESKPVPDLSDARLELMSSRARAIEFRGKDLPKHVRATPLFRYDDLARGYQDGTVWRLGEEGRPLAIVTTELHPRYGMQGTSGSNPRVVYDLLSMSPMKFAARSNDIAWSPNKAAVEMKKLPVVGFGKPAASMAKRMLQLKRLARRFKAIQIVDETGTEDQQLVLRLLPQNIDRYQPNAAANSDGALFLFVAGRMPGVIVAIETDGNAWEYGVGRLSGPSKLSVSFDDQQAWAVGPSNGNSTNGYFATNGAAILP